MKQITRAFALGILTTTLLLGVIYFLEDDQNNEKNTTENNILSTEDMIEELESQGYTITEEEIEPTPNDPDLSNNDVQDESPENETEATVPESYSLTIESGMTISQVADSLEAANIIEDSETFITYLNDNDYGTNIQVGEFELNTEMTLQEVADTIANQN